MLRQKETSFEFFKYIFDVEIIAHIELQSNLYAGMQNKNVSNNKKYMHSYLGVLIMSSVYKPANVREMWHPPITGY